MRPADFYVGNIPAKVRELSEKDAFELQLIENIRRMTFNPIDEARAFKKYTTEFGWGGESDLARTISRSEQFVSNRIQLRLPKSIIDEISQNRLRVSHALEIINLDENEQKIINDAIISESLTVRDIRNITKNSKLNKKKKVESESEAMLQAYDSYYTKISEKNDSIGQQIRLLKKALLCLRVSLYRLDSLIHESDEKLGKYENLEVDDILMQFRLDIHSMVDKSIRAIAKSNKKL